MGEWLVILCLFLIPVMFVVVGITIIINKEVIGSMKLLSLFPFALAIVSFYALQFDKIMMGLKEETNARKRKV